jgi:hypothetical protein
MKTSNVKKVKKATPAKKSPAKRGRPVKVAQKSKPATRKPAAKKKIDKFAVVAAKIDALMAQVAEIHQKLNA